MVSVLFFCPWQWLWFLGGHLDFLCCDPGGGAFLDWSACHHGIWVPNVPFCHIWNNGNHVLGSLLCQLGAVRCSWDSPWRVQMCVTMAAVAGVGCPPFVLADCVHGFGAVGEVLSGMLDGKVIHSNVSQLIGGCLEGLGHKFSKELSLMAVCTDDTVM